MEARPKEGLIKVKRRPVLSKLGKTKLPCPVKQRHTEEKSANGILTEKLYCWKAGVLKTPVVKDWLTPSRVKPAKKLLDSNFESLLQHDHRSALKDLNCKVETHGDLFPFCNKTYKGRIL